MSAEKTAQPARNLTLATKDQCDYSKLCLKLVTLPGAGTDPGGLDLPVTNLSMNRSSFTQSSPGYAELHALSNFSFLRGASHPEELVEQAHALGYSALALTDECSLAGVVRAHTAAKTCGIKLIIGTEVTLTDGLRLVLLATDKAAYGHLSVLITQARRKAKKGDYRLARLDLQGGSDRCLALMLPSRKQCLA